MSLWLVKTIKWACIYMDNTTTDQALITIMTAILSCHN